MNAIHTAFADQGLTRPKDGRLLAGVCAGIARRFGWDPWLVRILVVTLMVALPGSQLLAYPIAWALTPEDSSAPLSAPVPNPWQTPTATTAYPASPQDSSESQSDARR